MKLTALGGGWTAGLIGLGLLAAACGTAAPAATAAPGVSAAAALAPAAPGPGDWPMYGHDPSRTNYNPDETTISAANLGALVSRWQVDLGSNGLPASSGPSVAGGRVYIGSSAPSGPNFFALDALSGAAAWKVNLGYQDTCFNVGIGATPAIAGNVVVAGGGDAAYYGLDAATGNRLWRHALDVGASGFPWASPLPAGNRVYLGIASRCDNPSVRGEVRAVSLQNGSLLANRFFVPAGVAGAGIWQSPALSPDGGTLVVATGEDYHGYNGAYNRAMLALDPQSLAIRQADKEGPAGADSDFGSTPLVFHDGRGRILAGATHKDGTFFAYRLDSIGAGPIWHLVTGVTVGMMPGFDPSFDGGGMLLVPGSGAQLYALDPADGTIRWTASAAGRGNLAIANGLVFVNGGANGLKILDERTGHLLRTLTPAHAGSVSSGVAVAHGFVYLMSGPYLNAWSLPAGVPATPSPAAGPPGFADPAFQAVWTRTDQLVAAHQVDRSWLWGPAPDSGARTEPYREGANGQRLVQYFDKSRMEINHPAAARTGPFYVTNGLLVVELISGHLQVGDAAYETRAPADIPVAGDTTDPTAPTYRSLQGVANTILGDHRVPDRTGQLATATLARDGTTGADPSRRTVAGIDFVHYEPLTGHNIPRVFWAFLTQQGPVITTAGRVTAPLSDPWFYASGLPISEPYWATVQVADHVTPVLLQAFERRVLTYTPANTAPFQVEVGNVGLHYYQWRYGRAPGP